ncbi:S-adenosyl-L-methionine-dependent methyltransferase [Lentzea sp. NBRC 105346]|uniref:SAM-dependent methyltransferase n=1 Tax=Lentzea sp. NBRC 105346 TaxID=3032205 RepID=UPI0024A2A246|nr:SAM-dependent methyltransferase [Lentzea sp. NBRC 105346]GLZ36030.1 S-adenosyl-L-methionine-dependent methyltransferase [Lentzea sp. NBRC 105346]
MLTGVSKTALGVARVRAFESRRPDRLFDDSLAQRFVDAAPDAFPVDGPMTTIGAVFHHHAVIRTRFLDDFLLASECRQVVLLAAGLDTRAFRLDWPDGTTLFEADLPEVFAFKDALLSDEVPRCDRRVVAMDLRDDWNLPGFDATKPTAWVAEGLLIYLDEAETDTLLSKVDQLSAPGSEIAFERGLGDSELLKKARDLPGVSEYSKLWKGGLDTGRWLTGHGWRTHDHDGRALAERWGRVVPEGSAGGFLTATK